MLLSDPRIPWPCSSRLEKADQVPTLLEGFAGVSKSHFRELPQELVCAQYCIIHIVALATFGTRAVLVPFPPFFAPPLLSWPDTLSVTPSSPLPCVLPSHDNVLTPVRH